MLLGSHLRVLCGFHVVIGAPVLLGSCSDWLLECCLIIVGGSGWLPECC